MAPQSVEVSAQLTDDPLGGPIVQLHVGDRRHVRLGTLDLTDGCAEHLTVFPCSPPSRQLDDCVAHVSNVGGRL